MVFMIIHNRVLKTIEWHRRKMNKWNKFQPKFECCFWGVYLLNDQWSSTLNKHIWKSIWILQEVGSSSQFFVALVPSVNKYNVCSFLFGMKTVFFGKRRMQTSCSMVSMGFGSSTVNRIPFQPQDCKQIILYAQNLNYFYSSFMRIAPCASTFLRHIFSPHRISSHDLTEFRKLHL